MTPSGKTLDPSKGNIWEVRSLQWLGVGHVCWFVNGILVHISEHAGIVTRPYTRSMQLPIRVVIRNDAGVQSRRWGLYDASDGLFFQLTRSNIASQTRYICSSVLVDGGQDPPEVSFGYTMGAAITCPNGVETYLFSIRPAATYGAGGQENRMVVIPTLAAFQAENQRGAIRIVRDMTLTNATWAVAADPYSSVQIDTAATAFAGGQTVVRPFININSGLNFDLSAYFNVHGRKLRGPTANLETLTVLGIGEAAPSSDIRGSLAWREIR